MLFPKQELRSAEQWRRGSGVTAVTRVVPDEAPVGISYDGKPHVVLMATPDDVEDLAVGFTISERVAGPGEIQKVQVETGEHGVSANVVLASTAKQARAKARSRTMEGRSSCGLCGVQHLGAAVRALAPLGAGLTITRDHVQAAVAALETQQVLGRATRATHAAAWANADGEIQLVREDVGRHNALDKVIGAAARARLVPQGAFIVVTSRCSYEMVEKAAMAGVSVLVAISAPTALAIRKAEECGLTLIALARADGHTVFTRPDRVVGDALQGTSASV